LLPASPEPVHLPHQWVLRPLCETDHNRLSTEATQAITGDLTDTLPDPDNILRSGATGMRLNRENEQMSEPRYRSGIIGLGFIGGADQVSGDALGQTVSGLDGTHYYSHASHPRVDLICGSSRDAGRRHRFEERAGVHTYADWVAMLDAEQFDIVSVATYAPQHAEMVIACAEKGVRAILCEKPIATTVADADRMVAACEKTGSLLVINHQRRFNLGHRRLRQLIADGGLGTLTSLSTEWPGGRLGNVGTHMFDAMQMVISQPAQAVTGILDLAGKPDCRGPGFADPGGWGMIRFAGDLLGMVEASDYGFADGSMTIIGSEGRASIAGGSIALSFRNGTSENWPPDADMSGMDRIVCEIVDYLDGAGDFAYDVNEAVRTLEAIAAFHVSHARGGAWVQLPLAGDERTTIVNSG